MEDEFDDYREVFSQDGVLLAQAPSAYISFINTLGTLYIFETSDCEEPTKKRFLEWKLNDVTIDSDVQDQEWAVVNTVQKRIRTLSGNLPPDYHTRLKNLRVNFADIKSFRIASKCRHLTLYDGASEPLCSFKFQHGNCDLVVGALKSLLKVGPCKRDKHLFVVYDINSPEYQELTKTFAALNLPSEDQGSFWSLFKNIKNHPYEGSLEAFSKVTNYVYRSLDPGDQDILQQDDLERSLSEVEDVPSIQHGAPEYELLQPNQPQLPKKRDCPRGPPLNGDVWRGQFDENGKLKDPDFIKDVIFRGGVCPLIRKEVWKYLLDYFPWDSTAAERDKLVPLKNDEYYSMKLQWKTITKTQEENFYEFSQRKSLIEKDVARTDRNLTFYAGDNNPNLQTLHDILMTYVMYNFDLGYVQGMSDLLSPILMLFQNESEAFWCFVGFMNKLSSNFDLDQAGMKQHLSSLYTLVTFIDPLLAVYLENHDSANMFFCFRWLLVWFKRELNVDDVMRFWEVLWTGRPCENFHLLVAVAILENEGSALIDNGFGFNEILKYINELNGKLDVSLMLNKAEGIFYQIKEAEVADITNKVRLIVGLPPLERPDCGSHEDSPIDISALVSISPSNDEPRCSVANVRISPDELSFERSIDSNFL